MQTSATDEPIGGQPAPGEPCSVADLDAQVRYQRAFEAVLWSLPRVTVQNGRTRTFQAFGMRDNDIIANSGPATPKFEAVTSNSTTPYIVAYTDLKRGPVVLEVPPAGPEGSLYGQIVDSWQMTIADIGPSGIDGGTGGRLLLTGPDFDGEVPAGYRQVRSPNHRIALAFRSVPGPGKSERDAYEYSLRLRMYSLSEADDPPAQRFVDTVDERLPTLAPYDETFFERLHETLSYEPVRPEDRHIVGLLRSLGVVRGEPFAPDEATRALMRRAAVDAWFYLQQRFDQLPRDTYFWPDRQYVPLMLTDRNRQFSYEYPNWIDIDARAMQFFWCLLVPHQVAERPAAFYLMAMGDRDGDPLMAGATYRVVVPANVPVTQFWSLTVYDRATMSFVYTETNRTTLDSYGMDQMVTDTDGSVTLYVGPEPPDGLASNWIPTGGKRPMPGFRFYGATDSLYDGTFVLPDFELVRGPD